MIIRQLSLTNFRIFNRLELEFPSHLNILVGENAQGKTSILEAVHLFSLMTSPVATHDREMINFLVLEEEIPVGRLVAVVEKGNKTHHIEIRLIINKGTNGIGRLRKEVIIDSSKKKLLDAVGYFNSVIFLPQMIRIIEDGPDERRKYLDRTLSQAFPGYVRALSAFNQGITRRNALLKQLFEQGGNRDQLIYWDELIAENGALIIRERTRVVHDLNESMCVHHQQLTDDLEQIQLVYLPSVGLSNGKRNQPQLAINDHAATNISLETIQDLYLKQLKESQEEDIRRGVTTAGPHRDELRFIVNDLDLGIYGSRGQIRTAVMSLKFAEVYWLKSKTGETPVLLLDETLAELDNRRRRDLVDVLEKNSQSIMTTTDLNLFDPAFVKHCNVWHLHDGRIVKD